LRRFGKSSRFLVHQEEPFNGGSPLDGLAAASLTPVDSFFVRGHAAVPEIDPTTWRLRVDGLIERPLTLGLDELAGRFARGELEAALQCAGNRRRELLTLRALPGELPWGSEAMGNASWSGFRVADLLAAAGPRSGAAHVAFEGLDSCARGGASFGFGGSIPLDKALAPETLLADRMNGSPLAPVHGFPLRALVPGFIGARSVKWLTRVTVAAEPSPNWFQRRSYRLLPAEAGPNDEQGPMLGAFALQCVILSPTEGDVPAGPGSVEGVALSGGPAVTRVEVSADAGRSWTAAQLERPASPWSWARFRARVELVPGIVELVARAWDASGATQPARASEIWNLRGYANNAWSRVAVRALAP